MNQIIISLGLLLGISTVSCSQNNYSNYNGKKWEQLEGSGNLIKLNPAIGAFSVIEVNNANVKIKIETGTSEYSMNISIDDNLKDFFKWKQDSSILKLSFDFSSGKYPRWLSKNNTVITIKAGNIEKLVNKGNSNIAVDLQNQPSFIFSSTGNPDIQFTGKIAELNLQSTGNADIEAGNLAADKIILSSNGNADIEVSTKELVEKEIKGNNDITNLYYASKKEREQNDDDLNEDIREMIRFKLMNNSAIMEKITLISYRPDRKGNGTSVFTLIPLGIKNLKFPAGTKIYLATGQQVNTVMGGGKISNEEPFLIVKAGDAGKVFQIK
jgi:hypothetical protein